MYFKSFGSFIHFSLGRRMRVKKSCFLLFLFFAVAFGEQQTLAVMEFGGSISKSESSVLTDKLINILIENGHYKLVERSMMEEILKEQGFQQSGCTDQECAITIGQLLGVQKMCMGSIGKIGSAYSITLRIVNVATAEIQKTASYDFKGSIEDVLYYGIEEAVKKLLGDSEKVEQASKKEKAPKEQKVKEPKPLLTPEQQYERKVKIKKIFAITSTAIAAGSAGASAYFWIDKKNWHDKYLAESNQSIMNDHIASEENSRKFAIVSTGVAGAFIPTAVILWVVKIKKPEAKAVSITPVVAPGHASLTFSCKF